MNISRIVIVSIPLANTDCAVKERIDVTIIFQFTSV